MYQVNRTEITDRTEPDRTDQMSSIHFWGGEIASTSFDLVIFSRGSAFKKTIDPSGFSAWSKITLRDGIPYWHYCNDPPVKGSECANIHSIWWNYEQIKGESQNMSQYHIFYFFIGPEEDCRAWSCQHEYSPVTGASTGRLSGSSSEWTMCYLADSPKLTTLYRASIPLAELTINGGGWSDYEEMRYDPYEECPGRVYSKKEFVDNYGSTLEWDMMSPGKILRRQMIGNTIVQNRSFLSPENINHLLDKYIETFM